MPTWLRRQRAERLLVELGEIGASDDHAPAGRSIDARDQVEKSRFAAAGWPDDRYPLTSGDVERHLVERHDFALPVSVDFAYAVESDERWMRHQRAPLSLLSGASD
jgi:hypothetical protein